MAAPDQVPGAAVVHQRVGVDVALLGLAARRRVILGGDGLVGGNRAVQIREQRQPGMVFGLDHRLALQGEQLGRGFAQRGANLGEQPGHGVLVGPNSRAGQRAQSQRQGEGLGRGQAAGAGSSPCGRSA